MGLSEKLPEDKCNCEHEEHYICPQLEQLQAELVKKDKQIQLMEKFGLVLQVELAEAKMKDKQLNEYMDAQAESIEELQAELAILKKAWNEFGWHKKDCMLFSIAEHPHCTCGFEQALKEKNDG